jgi:hypothetical protein
MPVFIYVITKLLREFRNSMCLHRLVPAAFDYNCGRPIVSGVRAYSLKGLPMESEKE